MKENKSNTSTSTIGHREKMCDGVIAFFEYLLKCIVAFWTPAFGIGIAMVLMAT